MGELCTCRGNFIEVYSEFELSLAAGYRPFQSDVTINVAIGNLLELDENKRCVTISTVHLDKYSSLISLLPCFIVEKCLINTLIDFQ